LKRIFFFDSQPPLGKQLIAMAAYIAGYNGDATFTNIGASELD
jgi:dolichyl-phosphate-mannose-protein mannosyltransferase